MYGRARHCPVLFPYDVTTNSYRTTQIKRLAKSADCSKSISKDVGVAIPEAFEPKKPQRQTAMADTTSIVS